ncbi:class F sortase [Amycolatopsis pigmentata]|uniref:Class F sortase n=1 Tax=Amycolatopsis pigmentata TaxID=450801 RepID=A0ABW5G0H9_9PSEU
MRPRAARRVLPAVACGLGLLVLATAVPLRYRVQPAENVGSDLVSRLAAGVPDIAAAPGDRHGRVVRPVKLAIPDIGVAARVVPTGLDSRGEFALPSTVDTVAWYRLGPGLGELTGSVVLGGHVDDSEKDEGAFFRLRLLTPGAWIIVGADDGHGRAYRVVGREEYPKSEIDLRRYFSTTGIPRLTLITCGGSFDDESKTYQDNVVVTAVPVPGAS